MVTRGDRKDHEKKLFDVLRKLEKAGYKASERKSEFLQNKMKWLEHEIDEDGVKPNEEKVKTILDLKHSENPKQLKSFFGAIQYLAKFLQRTDKLRRLLKRNTEWKWETEQQNDFETIKKCLPKNRL